MTCDDREILIGAYIDGELELSAVLELERHTADCPTCTRTLAGLRALRSAISTSDLRYAPPRSLEASIRRNLRGAVAQDPERASGPWFRAPRVLVPAFAMAMLVMFFAGASLMHMLQLSPKGEESQLADQVVDSHIRSLMANHIFDVASTDQHTVKPWFDGKLDYAPPVVDLATQGFPLIGGRLDYLEDRPVAALVYRRFKHLINLFVWPAEANEPPDSLMATTSRRGYHVVYWRSGGMTYWAVSDVNPQDLGNFAALIAQQTGQGLPEH